MPQAKEGKKQRKYGRNRDRSMKMQRYRNEGRKFTNKAKRVVKDCYRAKDPIRTMKNLLPLLQVDVRIRVRKYYEKLLKANQ